MNFSPADNPSFTMADLVEDITEHEKSEHARVRAEKKQAEFDRKYMERKIALGLAKEFPGIDLSGERPYEGTKKTD